jgi:UDPglucose--hexose-1-phosphate uridylyltransferase
MRLADGRELIYFDDTPGAQRKTTDDRDLETGVSQSEARRDPVMDEWVIMASHRQTRTHLPPADECPLDPSTEGRLTEIPADDYDVVVFENRFPSLHGVPGDSPDAELTDVRPGYGSCEVVCFTSDHTASFSQLSPERLSTVMDAWVDRTEELSKRPGVEYVFIFENRGEEIGVTLHHPHGQIYAYPFVPPRAARALESARQYRDQHDGCLFCDVAKREIADGERIIAETDHFVAFVPKAAHWPYEVHVYAKHHVADLPALSPEERRELVLLQADVLDRFDGVFDTPMPYIMAWSQAPVRTCRDLGHLRLEIFSARRAAGKLKFLAGSEAAAGAFVNDVLPEQAAERLRNATRRRPSTRS